MPTKTPTAASIETTSTKPPCCTPLIRPEYQEAANTAFAILEAVEAGTPPENWPRLLIDVGMGNYDGASWNLSCELGVNGGSLDWNSKSARLTLYCGFLRIKPGVKRSIRLPVPNSYKGNNWRFCESLMICAQIAFVRGLDKAAEECLRAAVNAPDKTRAELQREEEEERERRRQFREIFSSIPTPAPNPYPC